MPVRWDAEMASFEVASVSWRGGLRLGLVCICYLRFLCVPARAFGGRGGRVLQVGRVSDRAKQLLPGRQRSNARCLLREPESPAQNPFQDLRAKEIGQESLLEWSSEWWATGHSACLSSVWSTRHRQAGRVGSSFQESHGETRIRWAWCS